MAERSQSGDYYSPDWPYERSGRDRGRDMQRSRDEDQDRHYRGYYSRSTTPISYPGGGGYLFSESLTLHGPYAGRGPKGYKRSDQQIVEEACQRLERDGEIDASEIEVMAEDGVIRLRGTVPDRATKRKAEDCVESVYGARDVMNELRVLEEHKPGRRLKTNVEFYTALLLHGLGLETAFFTPTFAIGRAAGWTAHCFEQRALGRLIRPQSVYVGRQPH